MGNWIKINDVNELQTGDILETYSKIPANARLFAGKITSVIKHYSVVVREEDKIQIMHNKILATPEIDPIEYITSERQILRVLRTGVSDDVMIKKYKQCSSRPYNAVKWNCEDFVMYVTGLSKKEYGTPQKDIGIGMTILLVIGIAIVLYSIFK